ncbi:MAG: PTS sugar transporter subunit IIA, partial [Bacilli bacterium]
MIAPGVAMPHARPEDGVIKKGISITLLANPVMFGPDPEHEVKLIICLAATDNSSHLHLLQFVAEVISKEKRLNRLMHANTTDELQQCFRIREEK